MLRALRRELASRTTWSAVDTELRGETADVVNRTPRVHKLAYFSPIYEPVVDRTSPIRVLEIGGFYGDSVQMWQQYLQPDSLIVGIDVDSKLAKIQDSTGAHVRMGGENDSFLREVAAEFGPFDVIIDAGSKTSSQLVSSFRCLFDNALTDSGAYLIDDVFCDYWTFLGSFSFKDVGRALLDAMWGHYQVATSIANFRAGHLVVVRRAALIHDGPHE
ncbi:hypothetical protein A5707_06980 [Mycobacterium kyorinense]|uniref:Methyltransferase domain-containing protein n=2 Tax=Mycobacterium kyorinense TaxID=487514 RepID=A0A1A2YUP9_9MYCO|nr:hypothetical protein A5707_06980 [Mycobacterium kyorinense]